MKLCGVQATSILRSAAAISLLFAAVACEQQPPPGESARTSQVSAAPEVIGAVARREITLTDIEGTASLALYDIDMQRYRLVRSVLEAKLLDGLDTEGLLPRTAALYLEPPAPPKVALQPDPERVRPAGDYPIELVVFCNLESSHCVRLQQQLSHILPLYPGLVQYADRELILPFHRHAALAAEAGYCALAQDRYWQYRDLMFAGAGAPDLRRILGAGRAVGLSAQQFEDCVNSRVNGASVQSDMQLAKEIGVNSVPAVFVNGLYAGNQPEPGHLIWLIESELDQLDIASPRMQQALTPSAEPLQVRALLHASAPGLGLVALAPVSASQSASFYREGDALGGGMTVRRITEGRVEILNRAVTEWLGFASPAASAVTEPETTQAPEPNEDQLAVLQYPHRGVPVALDRTEVLVRMSDVAALEASLEAVPMTAGGFHLLKVTAIEPGGLYEMLGLEEGDVIVLVNEQPMHEGDKPLWHALQSAEEVRLRVMRKGGLAHHFTYRFND